MAKIEFDDVGHITPRTIGNGKVNLHAQPRISRYIDERGIGYTHGHSSATYRDS